MKNAKTKYFAERFWLRQIGCYHPTEVSLRRLHRRDTLYFWTLGTSLILLLIGFVHLWPIAIVGAALCLVILVWRVSSTLHIEQIGGPPKPSA
jgi:hypothetical protein